MAKLSQQLNNERERLQQQGRSTRTQRVGQQQAQQRYELEKQRFEALKEQAKKIQEEKFKDQVVEVEEQYNIYRPRRFDERTWNRMSQRQRDAEMRSYNKNLQYHINKKNVVVHSTATRTVEKTIPFTLEDTGDQDYSYKDVYEGLSPELKQFFDTPDVVLQQKAERIETTKSTVQEKLSYADQKIAEARAKYEEKVQKNREWFDRKRGDERDKYRDRYKERDRELEDDLEEEVAKWQGYKKGLSKGLGELGANKDVQFSDIERYAWDVADYEERKEEARNEQREYTYKQKQEIKKLEEAGYKPFVIEKSFKGNPESVELVYINSLLGDAKTITTVKTKGKLNVKDLQKIGYSDPQERTLEFAGKEYKFTSRVGIYKESDGDLVTPYGKTGFTEQELIKQSQDKAYQEWFDDRSKKGIYLNPKQDPKAFTFGNKTFIPTKDIIGYVDQGSISTDPKYMEVPANLNYTKPNLNAGWSALKNIYNKIPSGNLYLGVGGISPIKTTKYDLDLSKMIFNTQDKLEGKSGDVDKKLSEIESVDKILKEVEKENQLRFEDNFAKKIIYGEISVEKAQEEYLKGEDYKIIQDKYANEFERATGRKNIGWKNAFKYGSQKFGYDTGSFLLGRIATPKAVVETGAVVGGVVATYGSLSPAVASAVGWGLTGASAVYGGYKLFDPKSTPSEVFGGAVMLGTATAIAGWNAYKYLKSPVVTTKVIKPKLDTKTGKVVGYEQPRVIVKDLYGKTKVIEKTNYPKTLSRQVFDGRRTVVTTKWRALSNKYFNTNLKNIYEGVPTAQLGKTTTYTGLRGSYTVREPSGYQKALNLLKKYGYTDAQATATLRYYSPKIIDTEVSGINILTYGDDISPYSVSKTTVITKQPKIVLDDELGISTRGAKTIKDVYSSQKAIVGTKGELSIIKEASTKTTGFLTDKGGWYNKITQAGKTQSSFERGILAKSSDIKTGTTITGYNKDLKTLIGQEYKYQNIKEVFAQRQIIPKKYQTSFGSGKVKLVKNDNEIFINQRELTGFSLEKVNIPKPSKPFTPIEKMSNKQLKNLIKDLQKVYGTGKTTTPKITPPKTTKDIQKVIEKLDDIGGTLKTPTPSQSKYYGTGMYERTDVYGGLSPQQLKNLDIQQNLKTLQMPDQVKVMNIKNLIKIKQLDTLAGLKIGQLSALKVATGLKSDLKLKSELKTDLQLKNLLKEDVAIKSDLKFDTALKSDTVLKSQLKSILDLKNLTPSITETSLIRPPRVPDVKTPIPKPFVMPFLKAEISKRVKKGKIKGFNELAYLPDFTSRALGLSPETLTEKQAQKRLKKLLTGFEVRRGITIKDLIKGKKRKK